MEALILSAMVAAFIQFVYYCIGSPSIDPDTGNPQTNSGRIFSIYGRFICSQYVSYENKENDRIRVKFDIWKANRVTEHEFKMAKASPLEQHQLIEQLQKDIENAENEFYSAKKPNPWMAAGLCPICFGTWVASSVWMLSPIAFGINPAYIIFGIAASVLISNRIKI